MCTEGENGTLDVLDKNSDISISDCNGTKNGGYQTCAEKNNVIYSLQNPASFPILCST